MNRFIIQIISFALVYLPWMSHAAGSATTTGSFPVITDTEGTGSIVGGVGSNTGGAVGGASGGNGGAFQLSTGAVVGISVACALVVLGIVTLWALWFVAKRRQWTIRETISRASRRLTGRKVPPTPSTPHAPKAGNQRQATVYGSRRLEEGHKDSDRSRSTTPPIEKPVKATPSKFDAFMGRRQ